MDVREKLVEIIQNSVGGCARHWAEIIADGLIANGVTVQEWISVEDRLPAKGTGQVLVIKRFNGKSYVDIGWVIEGKAYCYSDDYRIRPKEHILTHWMPLPQPPKGE